MKSNKILQWALALLLTTAMTLAYAPLAASWFAYADAGDVPAHAKSANDNQDGTVQLELSVTGDADNVDQSAGNVDVVVVYDVSQSMSTQDVRVGNRNYSRADQAEDVVHDFLTNLDTYSTGNNIRVSLVNFGQTASQIQGWTTNVTGLANRFDDGGTDGNVNFTYNSYGTNWEHALRLANTLVNSSREDVPTFVIHITDGAPTATGTTGSDAIAPTGATIAQLRERYNAATDEAYAIQNALKEKGGDYYAIYAYGTEADLLDDLMVFSENGQHRGGSINNVVAATQDAPRYFNASDTSALQAAIDKIFDKIVQAMGISSAAISDGTTSEIETSTGEISELLEVDESSYQYWLSIPVVNNKFTRTDTHGDEIEYTVTDNGDGTCTVSWRQGELTPSVTVDGSVSGGQFKYEWKEANALYDYDPPAAQLNGSSVDWNLRSVGTLLDGVTYSVTFDVYPSQTSLDYVADIKNDPSAWDRLDPEIQKYIDRDGKLKTNTTATLTYTDTRTGESGQTTYTNPDPVSMSAVEQMAVTKAWENEIDSQSQPPVTLTVTRDGEPKYPVTLSDPSWTNSVYVSVGIMRENEDGEMEVLEGAEGHDFTFTEPEDLTYHWELDVPVVHPMMINGTTTMLIKVDDKHPAPTGATTYTIGDGTYYADEEAVALTATNERRSRLFLTKEVTGEGAPEGAEFPFVINVVNSLAPEEEPEDDPDHETDYWVWISARDKDGNPIEKVDGATHASGSYWYAPSGTDVTVTAQAGCSIMVANLPTESTYTITEGDLPAGFIYSKTELDCDGKGTGEPYTLARTTTGTIDATNTKYTLTYTNEYAAVDVTVDKVWDDGNDQDRLRPSEDEFELTLKAGGETITEPEPTMKKSEDGNTWTYTWSGLDKYDSEGEVIEYQVTEEQVQDYDAPDYGEGKEYAVSGGTITNKHTPETVDISVEKVWEDSDNEDGTRPDSVSVQLMANGSAKGDLVTLDSSKEWKYTWEGLDKNKDGEAIEYTVEEPSVPEGYTKDISGDAENGFKITNTHVPETEIHVTKKWDDSNDQDGIRPDSIQVQLYAGDEPVGDPVTLNEAGNWSYNWKGIPKYKEGDEETAADNDEAVTTEPQQAAAAEDEQKSEPVKETASEEKPAAETPVAETPAAEEAKPADTNESAAGESNAGADENVEDLEAESAEEKNAAVDETPEAEEEPAAEEPAEAPAAEEPAAPAAEEVAETPAAETAPAAEESKAEEPKEAAEEKPASQEKPDKAEESKPADAEKVTAEPKAADGDEEASDEKTPIEYTVKEVSVPSGYEVEVTGDAETGFTITNTHTPETTEATVKKVWDDKDDATGMRPESLTVTLSNGDTVTLNEENGWTATVSDLPKNKDGKAIKYTWSESSMPDGYSLASSEASGTVTTLTNKYKAPDKGTVYIDPPVQKIIEGTAPSKSETYTFKLEADDPSFPMPKAAGGKSSMTMTIKGEGIKEFGKIEFTEPGVYTYKVTEVAGSNSDCDYDGTVYTVRATVDEDSDGNLHVQREYFKDGVEYDAAAFEFVNVYPDEPDKGTGVKTGDDSDIMGLLALMTASAVGLAALCFRRRREEQ